LVEESAVIGEDHLVTYACVQWVIETDALYNLRIRVKKETEL